MVDDKNNKNKNKLDAGMWRYHANRMDARRTSSTLKEWTRTAM